MPDEHYMVDGRTKGEKYENSICRLLSVWLVPGDWKKCLVYKLPFRRRFTSSTPLEGHWDGQGDILHKPGIAFPFCVECKNQEGWELDGMLVNAAWPPWGWWKQAKEQARKANLSPLMFFTRRYHKTYIMLQGEVGTCLNIKPNHGPLVRASVLQNELVLLTRAENLTAVSPLVVEALSPRLSSIAAT